MKNLKGFSSLAVLVVYLVIIAIPLTGWVKNIIKLSECDFEASYKAEVIRVVGVISPPVGVITGFMDIEDIKE